MVDFRPLSGVFMGVLFGVLLMSRCLATDVGVFNGVLSVLFRLGVFHPNPNNSAPLLTTSSSSLSPPSISVKCQN